MSRQMKDSGIEWFGMIPNDWEIVQVKRLFDIGRGRVIATTELSDQGYPVYSSQTKNNGVLGYIDSYDFDRSQLTWTTDGANAGTVFLREGKHNCTNVCGTLMPKNDDNWLQFLKYILEFTAIYHKRADINGFKIMNNEMADIHILLPIIDEQIRIADYLDQQCAHIDAVIEKTKASIEEYKKLKQAVITRAVTKGIRGDRPMKDSGIEWISELPKDWEIKRFKFVADSLVKGNGITKDDVRENGDIPCVRYGEIYTKYDNSFKECVSATNEELIGTKQYFSYGDLLFTCTGELVEEIGKSITYIGNEQCLAGGDIIIARHHQNPVFLNYALNSAYTQAQKSCNKNKLKVVHISAPDIANIVIVLPTMEEQEEIAQYLDEKCGEIKRIIEAKQQQLQVILDYKKSLIYEYVTGKKEVPQSCQ